MATIPGARRETGEEEQSFSELLGAVTGDLQKLFRQELALAKAEMREEAVKTGKAAGLLSGAALVVAVVWAIVGAVLAVMGRNRMREVSPKPERTIETLKEDAQWAKHPTR